MSSSKRPSSATKVAPLSNPPQVPAPAASPKKTEQWFTERAGPAPVAAASAKVSAPNPSRDAVKAARAKHNEVLGQSSAAASAAVNGGSTPGLRPLKLRLILPVPYSETIDSWFQEYYPTILRPNVTLEFGYLDPAAPLGFITSDYANSVQIPYVIKACQKAQMDGCDGVLIDIAFDTGMDVVKHCIDIPCVGALQSAVGVAQSVCGNKFSILSISPNEVPVDYRIAKEYQFLDKLASVHPINVAVLDLQKDFEKLVASAYTESIRAIATDGADTIILGCTGMVGLAARLQSMLGDKIPILDGCAIGLYNLEDCARLNLRQSKQWFDAPDQLIPLTPEEAAKYPVIPLKNPPSFANVKTDPVLQHMAHLTANFAAHSSSVVAPKPSKPLAKGDKTASGLTVKTVLNYQDIQDIMVGAQFYGSGGGGKISTSQEILLASVKPTDQVNLVDIDTLADSDYGIVPCDIGEPSQPIDLYGKPYEAGTIAVNLAVAATPGAPKLTFISSVETGCISYIVPIVSAIQLGLPLLDGDGGGRAVPQMEQLTYSACTPVGPLGLSNTDPSGNFRCTLNTDSVANAESLIRPILGNPLIEGNLAMACWGGTGAAYKKFIVRDCVTRSQTMGSIIRTNSQDPSARFSALLGACNGTVLFGGYLLQATNTATGGFDFGSTSWSVTAGGPASFWVQNKNENMAAYSANSTHPVCLAPDLISFFDFYDGIPFTNAEAPDYASIGTDGKPGPKAGKLVYIVASSANPAMWGRPDIVESFQQVMQTNFSYFGPMLPFQKLQDLNKAASSHSAVAPAGVSAPAATKTPAAAPAAAPAAGTTAARK